MNSKELLDQINSEIPKPQPLERKEIIIPDEIHDKIVEGVVNSIKEMNK